MEDSKNICCPTCLITPLLKYVDNKINFECLNYNENHQKYEGLKDIDNFLLNPKVESYKCIEHNIKFKRFCKKCKKNICI